MERMKNKKGYSLVELLIAIAIFSIAIVSIAGILVNIFGAYGKSKNLNKNIQNAQQAMNLISKSIRTSSVLKCDDLACTATGGNYQKIKIYDYSQGKCIYYQFTTSGGQDVLRYLAKDSADKITCDADAMGGTPTNIISEGATGYFKVFPSVESASIGRITISMRVTSGTGAKIDSANIQSSLSLRDYAESKL